MLTSYERDPFSDLSFNTKLTHKNLYLNPGSYHHPSNIQAVLSTLVHRAMTICDKEASIICSTSKQFSVKMGVV